nr:hypothetical protein [Mycoplasmopsis bovis]
MTKQKKKTEEDEDSEAESGTMAKSTQSGQCTKSISIRHNV